VRCLESRLMRCVAHASANHQSQQQGQGAVLRADDISGSKTALANPSLTLQLTHVLLSPPSPHIPTAKPITHHSTPTAPPFTNASPVQLRRLLSHHPRDLDWATEHRPSGNMPRGASSARDDAKTQDATSPQEYP
jgi:hypothetical protein